MRVVRCALCAACLHQVLDFRKLDANLFTMARVPVSVADLVASACRHCRAFLRPEVGLRFRVIPPDARAMVDARRVIQILTNGLRWESPWLTQHTVRHQSMASFAGLCWGRGWRMLGWLSGCCFYLCKLSLLCMCGSAATLGSTHRRVS
jgi:hypothetical protein